MSRYAVTSFGIVTSKYYAFLIDLQNHCQRPTNVMTTGSPQFFAALRELIGESKRGRRFLKA